MEWIVGIIVFVFVVLYFVGSAENKRSETLKSNKLYDDSEFEEKNFHFINFKKMQELMVKFGNKDIVFKDKRAELKYFHFMMGAIDRLSRLIADEKGSEVWFMIAPVMMQGGTNLIPQMLETYGRSGDQELYDAGKLGFEAMQTYLEIVTNKITQEEGNHFELALAKLLRS